MVIGEAKEGQPIDPVFRSPRGPRWAAEARKEMAKAHACWRPLLKTQPRCTLVLLPVCRICAGQFTGRLGVISAHFLIHGTKPPAYPNKIA